MTAIADLRRAVGRGATSRAFGGATLALALNGIIPSQALAQVGGSLAVESDYLLRGSSLTDGDPAAIAQLTYDHSSGMYLNFAGVVRFGPHDPRFMGVIGNVGYARQLNASLTLDAGVIRSQIRSANDYGRPYHYTEFYGGASIGRVTGRVYYSPDYRSHGVSTLYGELEAGFEPVRDWRVNAHIGVKAYLDAASYETKGSKRPDWRVGISKRFGRVEAHAALSGGGPGKTYYGYYLRHNPAITGGASISF